MKFSLAYVCVCVSSLALAAGGGGGAGGTGGVPAPGTIEVRTFSEKIPAGGTVQVKHALTTPQPIMTGGGSMYTDSFVIDGVAVFSPLGDTAAAAFLQGGYLYIGIVSPNADFGTNLDYPFLTVTMDIPATKTTGSTMPLGLTGALQTADGLLTIADKPGTLTIGGSVSIRGVYPGGGSWLAGTQLQIEGTGFQPGTKISTKMKASNALYVSSTRMTITLQQSATLDQQPFNAVNPDGSQVTYYSYLRGKLIQQPSRPLLQVTEPAFQSLTHAVATVTLPALTSTQFVALALQNPTLGSVSVTFQDQTTGAQSSFILPAGGRLMEDVATLLGGAIVNTGDVVTVTATSAIQILGINGDENLGVVTPFLPAF